MKRFETSAYNVSWDAQHVGEECGRAEVRVRVIFRERAPPASSSVR